MEGTRARHDAATCRVAIAHAAEAVSELLAALWQVQSAELGELIGQLDRLASVAGGARVAVAAEAQSRGEIAASQAGSTAHWVATHAPSLAAGTGATAVGRLLREGTRRECASVLDAVTSGQIGVPVALAVLGEFGRLRPRLRDGAAPTVLAGLLDLGRADGARGVRALRPALLAAYGADGEFQADADAAARLVSLSGASTDELGSRSYRLTLDPEGAAVLEAAIGPLSAPVPGPDGERDPRSPQTRRGQALIEVCRRATAAADRPPTGVKATLLVTMSHDELVARTGAASILGSTAAGTLLAPEQVRRVACDAAVIPAVLGSRGELLDLGRSTRLATPAQLAALWWRDRGCTFPGCGTPAHWCDAHHVRHWIDGGATDLANLALLCGRHHTVVHRDRLTARIDPQTGTVSWDTGPGGYGRAHGGDPPTAPAQVAPECDPWHSGTHPAA